MERVRCICACRTGPPLLADLAVSSIATDPPMAAAFAAQSLSGGNCTTRKTLPPSGGATCMGSWHGSCSVLSLLSAGVDDVFQKSVTAKFGLSMIGMMCGDVASERIIDRPFASCPVTTRRKRRISAPGRTLAAAVATLMQTLHILRSLRNDRQQQMGRPSRIVIDLVQRRSAAADVIGDVFGIGGAAHAGRHIGARDLHTDAVAFAEEIGRGHDLDRIFVDLAWYDLLLCLAGQRMPRFPWLRSLRIESPVRGLQPAACHLPLMNIARKLPLAFAHCPYRCVRPDVLERDDPVGVVLVDLCK